MKLSENQQIKFFMRLHVLVRAGLTLPDSLGLMKGKDVVGIIASHLAEHVHQGRAFYECLQDISGISAQSVQIIRIGELHGMLAPVLGSLSESLKRQESFRKQLIGSLLYPLVIMSMCLLLLLGMFIFIIPRMLGIFSSMQMKLPLPTQILLFLYYGVAHFWWIIGIICALCTTACIGFWRYSRMRKYLEHFFLKIPILGSTLQDGIISVIFESLALPLGAGIPLAPALRSISGIGIFHIVHQALQNLEEHVRNGKPFSEGMALYAYIFPVWTIDMIKAGEASGSIVTMCKHTADMHQELLLEKMQAISKLIEPALMICIGIVTGFIAVALMMPLYQITSSLSH